MAKLDELKQAKQLARGLDARAMKHLKRKRKQGLPKDIRKRFEKILKEHSKAILAGATQVGVENSKNLYALVGAKRLARANELSRLVSTHLGRAWEEMAAQSHLALSPEATFKTRILGIDIIILDGDTLRHTQIKTQKNTLTGSQKSRSVAELKIHPSPLFAAAFDVSKWTFPSTKRPKIERLAGEAFWAKLEIDYKMVVAVAKNCLLKLERKLFI